MFSHRRTPGDVLGDKRGIAASIPEALAGALLKAVVIAGIGSVLAGGIAFWALATSSAATSSGFQNARVAFEQAVAESDVVVGAGTNRVGLLRTLPGGKCEVQTWQGLNRDGSMALQVDTATKTGACSPTTGLLAAGSSADSLEYVFDINTPTFTYENLGGRDITFNGSGSATLASGVKDAGVKQANWDDLRPYKVTMALQTRNADSAAAAKKSETTGYTNVVAVTAAADDIRYVPAEGTDPIPGPVKISGITRSSTTGALVNGTREGIAVQFTGAVCLSGPTKVTVSYDRLSPSTAPSVNTVVSLPTTGGVNTVHLAGVPNGSAGDVTVSAVCLEGGVASADVRGFMQKLPAPELTVREGTSADQHVLSWSAVSSLRTSFQVSKTAAKGTQHATPAATTALTMTLNYTAGTNYGNKTDYRVSATITPETSMSNVASVTATWPATDKPTLTSNTFGATWTAVTCPAGTTPQYASRYYQQVGTDTTVTWSALSAYSTSRTLTGNPTPAYGRTTTEARARCVSTVTGLASAVAVSGVDRFYMPEAIDVTAARSTSAGTAYQGAREGLQVTYTGGRCYNSSSSAVTATWQPATPSGQSNVSTSKTSVLTGDAQQLQLTNVRNGAKGLALASVTCTAGKSGAGSTSVAYTQPLPTPVLTVTEGTSANQHVLAWKAVSSLPTTFQVAKKAVKGTQHENPSATTALTQTLTYTAGTNYGNKTDYTVTASVNGLDTVSTQKSITGAWPTVPAASGIAWKHTGATAADSKGTVSWAFDGACPAGTTLESRLNENRTGRTDRKTPSYDTTTKKTTEWGVGTKSYAWDPAYALQGYSYGVNVQVHCVSDITGLVSPVAGTQSPYFTTPVTKPAVAKWNAINVWNGKNTGSRPTYSTRSSCRFGTEVAAGGCVSIRVDYITYCPTGSWVGWSNFSATDWNPATYNHPFGWGDYWLLYGNDRDVRYHDARYQCFTPWVDNVGTATPENPRAITSDAAATTTVRVRGE